MSNVPYAEWDIGDYLARFIIPGDNTASNALHDESLQLAAEHMHSKSEVNDGIGQLWTHKQGMVIAGEKGDVVQNPPHVLDHKTFDSLFDCNQHAVADLYRLYIEDTLSKHNDIIENIYNYSVLEAKETAERFYYYGDALTVEKAIESLRAKQETLETELEDVARETQDVVDMIQEIDVPKPKHGDLRNGLRNPRQVQKVTALLSGGAEGMDEDE